MAGNTTKRSRLTEQQDQGRPTKTRRTGPGPEATPPERSRWERWQAHLSSPESPEDRRQRQKRHKRNQPTESGLQGPVMKDLRGENTPRPPYQGREGPGRAGSARRRIPQGGGRPPE